MGQPNAHAGAVSAPVVHRCCGQPGAQACGQVVGIQSWRALAPDWPMSGQRRGVIRRLATWATATASRCAARAGRRPRSTRSEEHTSELQSLMRISYAVFCLKKKTNTNHQAASEPHK